MVAIPGRARQYRAMQLFQPSKLPAAADIARHHHREPYATVVLTGAYEAAGDAGRMAAEAGEVLLHGAFSAPRDRIPANRTVVLDLPLPFAGRDWPDRGRIADPARLVRRPAPGRVEAVRAASKSIVSGQSGATTAT